MVWSTTGIVDARILKETLRWQRNTGKCFFRTSVLLWICCWLLLKGASVFSFEQNILDAELGIKNYRFPSGLTSSEVFQQLSKGDSSWNCIATTRVLMRNQGRFSLHLTVLFLWEEKRCVKIWPKVELKLFTTDLFCAGVLRSLNCDSLRWSHTHFICIPAVHIISFCAVIFIDIIYHI